MVVGLEKYHNKPVVALYVVKLMSLKKDRSVTHRTAPIVMVSEPVNSKKSEGSRFSVPVGVT